MFKIGDRVRLQTKDDPCEYNGAEATIVELIPEGAKVSFDGDGPNTEPIIFDKTEMTVVAKATKG